MTAWKRGRSTSPITSSYKSPGRSPFSVAKYWSSASSVCLQSGFLLVLNERSLLFFFCATLLNPQEILLRQANLFRSAVNTHHLMPIVFGLFEVIAVPGQMFAGHSNACVFPIKPMQVIQVAEHNITQFIYF